MAGKQLLAGHACLITGASRGIGKAIALAYAYHGVDALYLAARSTQQLEMVAAECRSAGVKQVEVVQIDLTKSTDVEALGNRLAGKVNVLVNNAGVYVFGSAEQGDVSQWATCTQVNMLAPMILTKCLAPDMKEKKHGVIINIGSIAGLEPMTENGLYSASKWGMRGWSLHCYRKLRTSQVKVMLINPGFVDTDMVRGRPGLNYDNMIQPADIAEGALLPFRTSSKACPEELTVRVLSPVFENDR